MCHCTTTRNYIKLLTNTDGVRVYFIERFAPDIYSPCLIYVTLQTNLLLNYNCMSFDDSTQEESIHGGW